MCVGRGWRGMEKEEGGRNFGVVLGKERGREEDGGGGKKSRVRGGREGNGWMQGGE